ncbi:glutaminyl cyclase [Cordyceps fumosorosea ARSEF 2679]|uniref:Peptide hydrolase n=1 Tax=Cordyceps fumosorosea (strain ARSEF 2679) TaxID=1081104 RepID=A0A167V5R0_CORFA|nr:glutaminyl cyclase [Cordyceps fumosorosea ARSEF 2679]OAA62253.1 glutaminyl cyclase [Cordyceps fumosorosea ARSEF 2679]
MRASAALLWTFGTLSSFASAIAGTTLTDDDLRNIPSPGSDFDIKDGKLLAPILIPRVPGTPGQTQAQKHLVDFFATQLPGWERTWHNSTSRTPATGDREVPFDNLIFRRDPPWAKTGDVGRLTLVAHYDSKRTPEGFIGATDSAAPCAMLLHAARSLDAALAARWAAMEASGEADTALEPAAGVQIIFLDGEEAFVQWTDEDSLYGARALAEHWEHDFHAPASAYRTPLGAISLFVLLDLLGAEAPSIPSYFVTTHWAYRKMALLERRMRDLGLLEVAGPSHAFLPDGEEEGAAQRFGAVQDDHVPFMHRGVDVLHLIPSPFPRVWHTLDDDGEHLHMPTTRDWAKIVTAFAAEWLDLTGMLPQLGPKRNKRAEAEPVPTMERADL